MDALVEAVARALVAVHSDRDQVILMDDDPQWREWARAAIAAIRETEGDKMRVDIPGVLDMLVETATALTDDEEKIVAAVMKGSFLTASPGNIEHSIRRLRKFKAE